MVNNKYIFSVVLFLLIQSLLSAASQNRSTLYVQYINKYCDLAVDEMKRCNIPASITLAQGILESGAGQSVLASKSNNHFGIKCGGDWKGPSVKHHDDARNECFRAYKNVKSSYKDHSEFLVNRSRYAHLFKLNVTDYKGWAQGLKNAGYATEPSYANKLIKIIEDYELHKYDKSGKKSSKKNVVTVVDHHPVFIANDLAYIKARRGDTFKSLGKELGIKEKKLIKYNDLHKNYTLREGDIIYLKEKHKKALKKHTVHVVKPGESIHYISQVYAVRLENLYKMNKKNKKYVPKAGDKICLR